jgi:FKBP-type peptidyl-prolyl cis-trans isomerase
MMRYTTAIAIVLLAGSTVAPALVPAWADQDAPAVSAFIAPPDVAAPPAGADTTASGLASRIIKPGAGSDHPKPQDTVVVNYTGWTTAGKLFETSLARKAPAVLSLTKALPGWREGLPLMVKGEKRRFWMPEAITYQGKKGLPAGMLVFDIELVDILSAPDTPPDVAKVPAGAEKRPSGLASRVVWPGTGTVHPKESSTVTVHYSGWTTDGKMFDSSVLKGQPITTGLDAVIPGWTEGVRLMVVGEKRRFWIPERLAYNGQQGKPEGMLVFDIELIAIK